MDFVLQKVVLLHQKQGTKIMAHMKHIIRRAVEEVLAAMGVEKNIGKVWLPGEPLPCEVEDIEFEFVEL